MASDKYEVLHKTVGYRTAGNAHAFARRGEVINLDAEQAKRHLGLGSVRKVEGDAEPSPEAEVVIAPAEAVVTSTVVTGAPESPTARGPEAQPLSPARDGSAEPALINAPAPEVTAPESPAEESTGEAAAEDDGTPMLNDAALSSMSVEEVREWVDEHPQHRQAVVEAEQAGKGRKGILDLSSG